MGTASEGVTSIHPTLSLHSYTITPLTLLTPLTRVRRVRRARSARSYVGRDPLLTLPGRSDG